MIDLIVSFFETVIRWVQGWPEMFFLIFVLAVFSFYMAINE